MVTLLIDKPLDFLVTVANYNVVAVYSCAFLLQKVFNCQLFMECYTISVTVYEYHY